MTKSTIKPPFLLPGKYSVLSAESRTGIILTLDGKYHSGSGKVFRIFQSKSQAEEYCQNQIKKSSEQEFIIHDWKRKQIAYFDPFEKNKK